MLKFKTLTFKFHFNTNYSSGNPIQINVYSDWLIIYNEEK